MYRYRRSILLCIRRGSLTTQPGLYIAWHKWLDASQGTYTLYKIGYSADLALGLHDPTYVTCFDGPWKYKATFEVRSADVAQLLETALLHCTKSRRCGSHELVNLPLAEILRIAHGVVEVLEVKTRFQLEPRYVLHASIRLQETSQSAQETKLLSVTCKSICRDKKPLLDHLVVPELKKIEVEANSQLAPSCSGRLAKSQIGTKRKSFDNKADEEELAESEDALIGAVEEQISPI